MSGDGAVPAALRRYRAIAPDWRALCAAVATPPPLFLWAHPARIGRDALAARLRADGLPSRPVADRPDALALTRDAPIGRHWGWIAGLFQIQDEASMLPAMLLAPRPGERVLDLCAAPGNKTAMIALAMRGQGTVVANDVNRGRLAPLRQTIRRLGLTNVCVTAVAGENYPLRAGPFDRILVDAPCSAEGNARVGHAVPALTAGERAELVARQRRLLTRAIRLCRVGGRVVYATCTLAPEENEAVVAEVLEQCGERVAVVSAGELAATTQPGLTAWNDRHFPPALAETRRLWPTPGRGGGFYVAVLEKRAGEESRHGRAPAVEPADDAPLRTVADRHGLDASAWDGLVPIHAGARYLNLVAADHRPPEGVALESVGLPAVSIAMKPVQATTAWAMANAPAARTAVVDLDGAGARQYLDRAGALLPAGALDTGDEVGSVMVRYLGHGLGVGRVGRDGVLLSRFPSAWAASTWRLSTEE